MANKKTVVEMFEEILENPSLTQEQRDFLVKRKEQAVKKNASGSNKPTKAQIENEGSKEQILAVLTAEPMAVADIQTAVGLPSNQKTTALLTQLLKAEKVVRVVEKGKAFYRLPTA